MEIGLFFGSFNPIHVGHLVIANVAYQTTDLDQVWFIVSPKNPFKANKNLLHEFDRIDMVRAAIHDQYHFQASDIEFSMPRPSFTIDTLVRLSEKYPQHQFHLIIGEDNLASFPKWKNAHIILKNYGLVVYPRINSKPSELKDHQKVKWIDAPEINISATLIRRLVRAGQSPKYLVTDPVLEIIESRKLFQD